MWASRPLGRPLAQSGGAALHFEFGWVGRYGIKILLGVFSVLRAREGGASKTTILPFPLPCCAPASTFVRLSINPAKRGVYTDPAMPEK